MSDTELAEAGSRTTVAPQRKVADPRAVVCDQCVGSKNVPAASFIQRTFDDPVAAFTLWLALATTGLWIFTGFLWRATYNLAKDTKTAGTDQADKMERSIGEAGRAAQAMEALAKSNAASSAQIVESVNLTRRAMRASISVVVGDAVYQEKNVNFAAHPRIINKGSTEAVNVRWKIAAGILPNPIPQDFRFPLPDKYGGGSVIGPQNDGIISAVAPQRVLPAEVDAVRRIQGRALYVWGYVVYKDIFGRTHRTTFCQQLYWLQTKKKSFLRDANYIIRGQYLDRHNRAN